MNQNHTNTTNQVLQVGTRVYSSLYGGRPGIVYNISGEQAPHTVRSLGGGIVVTGGSAYVNVVFDNGTISKRIPESIIRGVQWRILDDISTPEEIAAALGHAATVQAEEAAKKQEAANKHAAAVAALKADPEHAHLTQTGGNASGGKLVAINLRKELKKAFPRVKFSVRSDYDSVNIRWIDGPTAKQVEDISRKYKAGSFNGMEDIYEYNSNPWGNVFGDCKYIFTRREYSDQFIGQAIDDYVYTWGSEYGASVEDFRKGKLWNREAENGQPLQGEINTLLAAKVSYL